MMHRDPIAFLTTFLFAFRPSLPFVTHRTLSSPRFSLRHHATTIRDYQPGDGPAVERLLRTDSFDPEGPLQTDCGSDVAIQESYEPDGCFLVAVNEDQQLVGTAGLVVGTAVSYSASGSSFSIPITTGAVRRVCGKDVSIVRQLLLELENRANGADELIALAYPSSPSVLRPSTNVLGDLGYERRASQLKGEHVVQYGKKLGTTPQETASSGVEPTDGLEEALLGGFLAFLLVSLIAVANFLGVDMLGTSN